MYEYVRCNIRTKTRPVCARPYEGKTWTVFKQILRPSPPRGTVPARIVLFVTFFILFSLKYSDPRARSKK